MSKTFADTLRETRRLTILRLLNESNGYSANSSVLHAGLHHLGVATTSDDVLTDLNWLQEQGLVSNREVIEGVVVAELRGRGQEVAKGHVAVPGVTKPRAR